MKPLLFRFKIAFLSMLMSGMLVVGFALASLAVVGRIGIARIDNEIRALGEGQIHSLRPTEHWTDFDQSLHFIYGDQTAQRFAVRVLDTRGRTLFASEQWPEALADIEAPVLRVPAQPMASQAPPRQTGPEEEGQAFVRRLDRDGDNRVSDAEFDGPASHFQESDQDGDGFLTASEAPEHERPPDDAEPRRGRRLPERPRHAPDDWGSPPSREIPRIRPRIPVFTTQKTPAGAWRVGFMGNESVTLIVAADLAAYRREAVLLRNFFLVGTPVVILILGAAGWWLASRALRPVGVITRTAEAITARDLHRRVTATSADAELQRLVDVMNRMLERLERSFYQASRFSADAAHELQTPLTVLQGELDNAVQQAEAGSLEQQRYSDLLEEVRGLKSIVQKLLLLARADVGKLPLSRDRVDLSALVEAAIEDVEALAPGMTLDADVPPGIDVSADADLLGQVLRNMVGNATKYGQEGGTIRFVLRAADSAVLFTLSNTADPIPEEDRARIFDRFHRVDKARSRAIRGAGLGLSLAREIARAHGGDLVLDPSHDGMVSFTLSLPLS